ncbi:MAG: hypothetical protein KJZ59_01700, partial [Pararhodobacter sp.]|nr:hypothetical protein [Pararhodobacter sp.]
VTAQVMIVFGLRAMGQAPVRVGATIEGWQVKGWSPCARAGPIRACGALSLSMMAGKVAAIKPAAQTGQGQRRSRAGVGACGSAALATLCGA